MRFAMKRASVLALLLVSTACVSINATVLDLTPQSRPPVAATLGANGVILDAISEASAGAKIAGAVFGTGSQRKGRAVAIFVVADSAKAP